MKAALVLVALAASVAYAEPQPYTIDTKTGLSGRTHENALYNAVARMVQPVAKAFGLNEAEEECAKATAAQALINATVEALRGNLFGLRGHEEASRFFRQQDEDWCNGQGGKRGAEAIAPYAERAKSFVRPFLKEKLDELRQADSKMTPAAVAAAIAAALVALPVLAPL